VFLLVAHWRRLKRRGGLRKKGKKRNKPRINGLRAKKGVRKKRNKGGQLLLSVPPSKALMTAAALLSAFFVRFA
jgi:hypothetical protein